MADISNEVESNPLWGAVFCPKVANLWRSGYGCDVTIACQDGSVKAPSVLLSALSEKMHEVLLLSKDKVLNFINVDVKFWEDLLSWVYSGVLPIHMNDESSLPHLFSTLLVAHSLGMNDVLALYKHLSQVGKPGISVANIWGSFDSDIKMEVQMEYISADSDCATLVTFSSAVLNDLKDCMLSSPVENVKICKLRNKGTLVEEVCVNCDKKCEAEMVQCVYCRQVLPRIDGISHMDEAHVFSRSIAWPFSCAIDVNVDKSVVKGGKSLVKRYNKQTAYQYKCSLCNLLTGDVVQFMNHYAVHGFFPKLCTSCGDVFSDDDLKIEHFGYCRLRTSEDDTNKRLEVELIDAGSNTTFEVIVNENLLDLPNVMALDQGVVVPLQASDIGMGSTNFRKRCMACGDICVAKKVVCLYCNCITANDISHMLVEHAECKQAKIWAYTCDLERVEKTEEIVRRFGTEQGGYSFECKICHQSIENKEKVFFHVRNVHKIPSLFHCSLCESGFKSSSLRSRHQHLCGGGSFVRCQKCHFYGNIEDLRLHKEEEHDIDSGIKRRKVMTKPRKSYGGTRERSQLIRREQDGSLCFSCQIHCSAEKVKCVYCFKVVENNSSHMASAHPYTPKSSPWVYTCKFLARQIIKPREWVLFVKEPIEPGDKSKFHYRCTRCNKTVGSLEKATRHIKNAHHGYVKVCKYCENGFASFVHHKDHQHFCGGGALISCNMCNRNVGCYRSLYDHQTKWHTELEKRTLKGKPLNTSSDEESFDETQVDDDSSVEENEHSQIESIEDGTMVDYNTSGQPGCCNCESECIAVKVRCVYCGKIVVNNNSHMETCHPFTPKNSMWAYTCKFQTEASAPLKDWVVSVKEPIDEGDLDDNITDISNKPCQYKCVKCNTVFTSVKGVAEHIKDSHNITIKVCDICETGLAKQDQLEDHHHFCNGGSLLTCKVCQMFLGSYSLYLNHMSTEHPDYHELSENLIPEIFEKSMEAYNGPLEQAVKRRTVCFNCGNHCNAPLVKCMYCYKIVENNSSHMNKNHVFTPNNSAWVYQCKYAGSADDSQKWMASAKEPVNFEGKVAENKVSSQHRCSYCDICLPDLDSMLVHIKEDHGISHPVKVCDICDAVFLKYTFWKDHFHFCSGGDMLMCDTCGKEIGGYKALSDHTCPGLLKNIKPSNYFYEEGSAVEFDPTTSFVKCEPIEDEDRIEDIEVDLEDAETLDTEEMQRVFCEEKTQQMVANPKRCFTCGDNCNAVMVKCMYCDEIIFGSDNHMEKSHKNVPENVIWPVNCCYSSNETSSSPVSDMFIREADDIDGVDLKVYRCLICQEHCDTSLELSQHTQKVHKFVLSLCKICDFGFKHPGLQKSHQHFCSGRDLLKCSLCDKLVGNWTSANAHYYDLHKTNVQEGTGRKRKISASVSRFKRTKLTEEKAFCEGDSQNVNSTNGTDNFNTNKQDLEIPKGIQLRCIECEFKTTSISEINFHNQKNHEYVPSELEQICHFCFRVFRSRSKREKHEQHEHLSNQRVFCEKCGRDFEIPLQKEIHCKYFHKND